MTKAWTEVASTVAALARSNLQRNKDEARAHEAERKRTILTPFEASIPRKDGPSLVPQVPLFHDDFPGVANSDKAAIIWLDELGAAFEMPLEGAMYPTYTGVDDFTIAILDRSNGALVAKTLTDSHLKFVDDGSPAYVSRRMLEKYRKNDDKHFFHKVRFWRVLAGRSVNSPPPTCQDVTAMLKRWESAWACHADLQTWNSLKFERRKICRNLVDGADMLKMVAQTLSWSPDHEEEWLDLEEHRLLSLYEGGCRKRKDREGMTGDKKQLKVGRIMEPLAMTTEKMQLEADRSALKAEVISLKIDVEYEKAAKAALQATFDTEVVCQICFSSPRNVVLLPCRHGQFCSPCISEYQKTRNTCPTCRTKIETTISCIG